MISLILAYILVFVSPSFALDECTYFRNCGNSAGTKSTSTATSASLNPSNLASIKGLGVEFIYQPNNPLGYNIVTGNGKFGGAIISPIVENGFFGNRSIEIDDLYLQRRIEKKRFTNKKLQLGFGAKLIDKTNYGVDLGVSAKRNPDIKEINLGVGLSGRFSIFSLGFYVYNDDIKVDLGNYVNPYYGVPYRLIWQTSTYQEHYFVKTTTLGIKIEKFTLDVGFIKTHYDFYYGDTAITLYSAAYNYKKFLFNLAYRKESSAHMQEKNGVLVFEQDKKDYYGGIQYLVNNHLMFGVGYNNFLLKEWSMSMTLFL